MDVLRRPGLRRYRITERDVEDVLALLAPLLPRVDVAFMPRDPDDAHVVAAAVGGRADAIVTGDKGLLEDDRLRVWLNERGIGMYSPAELLERL